MRRRKYEFLSGLTVSALGVPGLTRRISCDVQPPPEHLFSGVRNAGREHSRLQTYEVRGRPQDRADRGVADSLVEFLLYLLSNAGAKDVLAVGV